MDDRPNRKPPSSQDDDRRPAGRSPAGWKEMAEESIEEAIRSGVFDNLPGRGKPLKLIENPYAPGTELAYQLLRDNQYTLPWISQRMSLLARIESLREEIRLSWCDHQAAYEASSNTVDRLSLAQHWQEMLASWAELIREQNKEIATLNLKQPADYLEIMKLSLDRELTRAGADMKLEQGG